MDNWCPAKPSHGQRVRSRRHAREEVIRVFEPDGQTHGAGTDASSHEGTVIEPPVHGGSHLAGLFLPSAMPSDPVTLGFGRTACEHLCSLLHRQALPDDRVHDLGDGHFHAVPAGELEHRPG